MIARCDRCDRGRQHHTGYRWYPAKAGLGLWRCPDCGGKLRSKRKGETEGFNTDAKLPNPPPVAPGVNIRKTGRHAGDVERERRQKRARA